MFKCEVVNVRHDKCLQETVVKFVVSSKGFNKTKNHTLIGQYPNEKFIIGQIDKSIKKGDLLRCDGLPYMSRPASIRKKWKYVKGISSMYHKTWYTEDVIPGYKAVQLDSGYWVYRKYK